MAVILTSLGDAECIQSRPAEPRVPTPIQPILTLSLAPRAGSAAGPAAIAAAFRKSRRLSSSGIRPPTPMIAAPIVGQAPDLPGAGHRASLCPSGNTRDIHRARRQAIVPT